MLRGKTMECISLIGIAVGHDIFIQVQCPLKSVCLASLKCNGYRKQCMTTLVAYMLTNADEPSLHCTGLLHCAHFLSSMLFMMSRWSSLYMCVLHKAYMGENRGFQAQRSCIFLRMLYANPCI
jgi:hypothetical protein